MNVDMTLADRSRCLAKVRQDRNEADDPPSIAIVLLSSREFMSEVRKRHLGARMADLGSTLPFAMPLLHAASRCPLMHPRSRSYARDAA